MADVENIRRYHVLFHFFRDIFGMNVINCFVALYYFTMPKRRVVVNKPTSLNTCVVRLARKGKLTQTFDDVLRWQSVFDDVDVCWNFWYRLPKFSSFRVVHYSCLCDVKIAVDSVYRLPFVTLVTVICLSLYVNYFSYVYFILRVKNESDGTELGFVRIFNLFFSVLYIHAYRWWKIYYIIFFISINWTRFLLYLCTCIFVNIFIQFVVKNFLHWFTNWGLLAGWSISATSFIISFFISGATSVTASASSSISASAATSVSATTSSTRIRHWCSEYIVQDNGRNTYN